MLIAHVDLAKGVDFILAASPIKVLITGFHFSRTSLCSLKIKTDMCLHIEGNKRLQESVAKEKNTLRKTTGQRKRVHRTSAIKLHAVKLLSHQRLNSTSDKYLIA